MSPNATHRSARRALLLTGAPRSGTTWIGRSIAKLGRYRYVHEPFSSSMPACACGYRAPMWFPYIPDGDVPQARRHLHHLIRAPLGSDGIRSTLALALSSRRVRSVWPLAQALVRRPAVLKDPLAAFSAEWLARGYDLEVLVVVRHPAAVASSYDTLGWTHDFAPLLDQPRLMKELLSAHEAQIRDFVNHEQPPLFQAALLWRLLYDVLLQFRERNEGWIFVRHEDLALAPERGYIALLDRLGLAVPEHTSLPAAQATKSSRGTGPYDIFRDPATTVNAWRNQISASDLRRIRHIAGPPATTWYGEHEW
jgi:hypothetical protein